MHLRLGWALIKSRVKIDEGLASLRKAHELDPNNSDVLFKLAGALLKERSEYEES